MREGYGPLALSWGFLTAWQLVKKVFLTSWWTGGASYPQFAMVVPLRLTACSTPLGFLTSCSYSQAKIQYPFLRASSSTRL